STCRRASKCGQVRWRICSDLLTELVGQVYNQFHKLWQFPHRLGNARQPKEVRMYETRCEVERNYVAAERSTTRQPPVSAGSQAIRPIHVVVGNGQVIPENVVANEGVEESSPTSRQRGVSAGLLLRRASGAPGGHLPFQSLHEAGTKIGGYLHGLGALI